MSGKRCRKRAGAYEAGTPELLEAPDGLQRRTCVVEGRGRCGLRCLPPGVGANFNSVVQGFTAWWNISLRRWTPRTLTAGRDGRGRGSPWEQSAPRHRGALVSENASAQLEELSLLGSPELGLPEALLPGLVFGTSWPLRSARRLPTTFYYIILPLAGGGLYEGIKLGCPLLRPSRIGCLPEAHRLNQSPSQSQRQKNYAGWC